jgi:hypothetical protein
MRKYGMIRLHRGTNTQIKNATGEANIVARMKIVVYNTVMSE